MENWLAHNLSPRVDFHFNELDHAGHRVILLRVQPALASPVSFKGTEWIRVGGIKKKLKEHPGKEKEPWLVLARLVFEKGIAAQDVSGDEVLARKYFELSEQGLPANRSGVLECMSVDRLIISRGGDTFDVTNLGAILFAKHLPEFEALSRNAFRVIRYKGTNRVETEHEKLGVKGYAPDSKVLLPILMTTFRATKCLGRRSGERCVCILSLRFAS